MKKFGSKAVAAAAMLVAMGAMSGAHAAWTFQGTSAAAALQDPAATLTNLSGVAVQNGAGNVVGAAAWATTALTPQGNAVGMTAGGETTSAPYHAIDNSSYTEAVLLGFSSSVTLSSIGLSYSVDVNQAASTTTDISLFRYTGTGAPPSLLNGVAANAMTNWELVGNYGDFKQDTIDPFNLVNSGGKGSSWWLISAYNSGFTGAGETRGTLDNGNDFFKVSAVAGTACTSTAVGNLCNNPRGGVPEPTSLALAGLALAGVGFSRRRKSAK